MMIFLKESGFFIRLSAAGNHFLAAVPGVSFGKGSGVKYIERFFHPEESDLFPVPAKLRNVFRLKRMKYQKKRAAFLKKTAAACFQRCETETKNFDGLMIIRLDKSAGGAAAGLFCDFFNKDGSLADLCGNAACCAAFFGKEIGVFKASSFSFWFAAAVLKGDYDEKESVWLSVPKPQAPEPRSFVFQEKEYSYDFVCPGVPHGVFFSDAPLNSSELKRLLPLAKALRERGNGKEGMNVTFYHYETERPDGNGLREVRALSGGRRQNKAGESALDKDISLSPGAGGGEGLQSAGGGGLQSGGSGQKHKQEQRRAVQISAATYERGVEDWTGACGTGALAAALSFENAFLQTPKAAAADPKSKAKSIDSQGSCKSPAAADLPKILTVNMPGGALKVRLTPRLQLSSPAQWGWNA